MNLNNYTIKAQEAIQSAQQVAYTNSNPSIETDHLLKALLAEKDSAIDFLLKKNNVNPSFLEAKLLEQINKLPKVQEGEPAQTAGRDFSNALLKANAVMSLFKDEFITPEHLLVALVQMNDATGKLLKSLIWRVSFYKY